MKQKKLCETCEIGEKTYKLDPLAQSCQYIYCYKDDNCAYYKPLQSTKQEGIILKELG